MSLDSHFLGFTSTASDPWISYRVYYVNQVRRGLGGEEWREMWEADQETDPLWTAAFDGVTYVWVFGAPPGKPAAGGPERAMGNRLGEHVRLDRVRLGSETPRAGETLSAVLVWTSDSQVSESYTVLCHLLSSDGELVAQRDAPPLIGVRPTVTRRAGDVFEDSCELSLDDGLAPGDYELSVGMYDPASLERVPAYDADGRRLPVDRIFLGVVQVAAPSAIDG